ncbi:MAG: sugar transferase [Terracidiphilus sp.]|jgi:exopolysaccharide biosynthesis polyprenyl glycosylphosphotransferase
MATSDFLQRLSAFEASSPEWAEESVKDAVRGPRGKAHFWMVLDAITIFASAVSATLYRMHTGTFAGTKGLWHGALLHGRPLGILLVFLCGFAVALILTSRRLNLYSPLRLSDAIREQRLSVQACLTSGLLLTGALYLVHAEDVPRGIVLITVGLVTIALSARRLAYRISLYRSFEQGVGTRNVLIVGTGPEAVALRYYLESIRHLGYRFKGFIEAPGPASDFSAAPANDVVGTLDTLFQRVRRQFVDEIFFTTPCERSVVQDVLEQARSLSVDLRIVPDMYNGVSFNSTIEYIGHFPTIPLHCGQVPEIGLLMKRGLDVIFSSLVLLLGWPLYMAIAIAVKLDSPGPVFYSSERVGKKGRAFRCFKFRTMVCDADKRRQELMNKNERDGVLFKITDDPRVTRLGRFLRRHSLDELPQFVNVLRGDMSVVGPRPLPADDVRDSKLAYLRVLAVTPGITGLWQVQGRQDPSSDSYISLNVIYIENWSIWLDIQIILRTIGVVLEGTGS